METTTRSQGFTGGTEHVLLAWQKSGTSPPGAPSAASTHGGSGGAAQPHAPRAPADTAPAPAPAAGPGAREGPIPAPGATPGRAPRGLRRRGGSAAPQRADTGVRGRWAGEQPALPSSLYSPGPWRGWRGAAPPDQAPLARSAALKLPLPCGSGCSRTKAARQPIPAGRRRPGSQSPPADPAPPRPAQPGLSQPRRGGGHSQGAPGAVSRLRVQTSANVEPPEHEKRGNLGL